MSIQAQWTDPHALATLPVRRKSPFAMRAMSMAIQLYSGLSVERAGRFVNDLWFSPRRTGAGSKFEPLLDRADTFTQFKFGAYELPVYSWGEGPVVLCVHGWSGAGVQFGALVEPLVAQGFRVVAFDAPGHGRAQGSRTNVFEMKTVLEQVAQLFGQIHGVVGHSLGAVVAVLAAAGGLPVSKLTLIAPPTDLGYLVALFGSQLEIPERVLEVHARLLEEAFGADVWDTLDLPRQIARVQAEGLVISDLHDRQIPSVHGEIIASQWPRSTYVQTRELGHNRILEDEQVVTSISAFMSL